MAQLPAALWLDHVARAGRLFDKAVAIFGSTQKAIIRSAEIQPGGHCKPAFANAARTSASRP